MPPPTALHPLRMVIDTDPGIDDALALLLAFESPELDVRSVVTVYGNTTLAHATRNAQVVAKWARSDVPVYAGADQPLIRPLAAAVETHGPSGLGEAWVPDAPPVEPNPEALLEALLREPEPVTLVTLGPLTNLAHALSRDAAAVRARVVSHIAMAGSLHAVGTATPESEFNVWCDPEAADLVLRAGMASRWVGLDVTRRLVLTAAEVERLDGSARRRWLRDALRQYVRFHREYEELDGCVINDPLIIAELLQPGIVRFEPVRLSVELTDGVHRGRTREAADGAAILAGVDTDAGAARALLDERVFRPEQNHD